MTNFTIDFFELSFLLEACIPPRPIARTMFWLETINSRYSKMSGDERARLHEWMNKTYTYTKKLEEEEPYVVLFENRFNPNNQYKVYHKFDDKESYDLAFLHDNEYRLTKDKYIDKKYITKIERVL